MYLRLLILIVMLNPLAVSASDNPTETTTEYSSSYVGDIQGGSSR